MSTCKNALKVKRLYKLYIKLLDTNLTNLCIDLLFSLYIDYCLVLGLQLCLWICYFLLEFPRCLLNVFLSYILHA